MLFFPLTSTEATGADVFPADMAPPPKPPPKPPPPTIGAGVTATTVVGITVVGVGFFVEIVPLGVNVGGGVARSPVGTEAKVPVVGLVTGVAIVLVVTGETTVVGSLNCNSGTAN